MELPHLIQYLICLVALLVGLIILFPPQGPKFA